ncbi:hypothetical protein DJ83_11175 [Halorubrum ezzemoulense]|uniref:Uncharacterized protein n=1 Tax=Halorubrum ezzemoulense TaxID=337243 RepID=A0A256IUR3_HALEZ|nr:hypothetical protein [Halorubrum ezzemoulense]OYR59847.1 hypothetical protein DJ83_11175 [Halorubrum ezzemoulense]
MAVPILAGLLSGPIMRLLALLALGAVVVFVAPDVLDMVLEAGGDAVGAVGDALGGAIDGALEELRSLIIGDLLP